MTISTDDLLLDAYREHHTYEQETVCEECGEGYLVRYLAGEQVDLSQSCEQCGGRLRPE